VADGGEVINFAPHLTHAGEVLYRLRRTPA